MNEDPVMALVIRMKYVSRTLIFLGGLLLWLLALTMLNDSTLNLEEEPLLALAVAIGAIQTWILAILLKT